jgi:hypothetical protein
MRRWLATLTLACAAAAVAGERTESAKDLGFGFSDVELAQDLPRPAFEAVGHFRYLYYMGTKVSLIDSCSVAKSGRFALFQDGPTGNVLLFLTDRRVKKIVVKYYGALVQSYEWSESLKKATIAFEDGRKIDATLLSP